MQGHVTESSTSETFGLCLYKTPKDHEFQLIQLQVEAERTSLHAEFDVERAAMRKDLGGECSDQVEDGEGVGTS